MREAQLVATDTEIRPRTVQGASGDGDRVTFIGNATLLIRFGSITVLTDPNFVHRDAEVPLGFGLTTTRLTDPALDVEEVPQPDLVIVSHDHGDHFDAVAADWLSSSVPIVTCAGAARSLTDRGFSDVRPLTTWETAGLEKDGTRVRITALPAQHAPAALAVAGPDGMGSMLEMWRAPDDAPGLEQRRAGDGAGTEGAPDPDARIYISGDTVMHDALAGIRDRFPQIDLAFVHLGGMRVMGMTVTMDATQGVQLINLLRPRITIPVHYNDYGTSKSKLAEFVSAVNQAGLSDRVRYLRHGDEWRLAPRRRLPPRTPPPS